MFKDQQAIGLTIRYLKNDEINYKKKTKRLHRLYGPRGGRKKKETNKAGHALGINIFFLSFYFFECASIAYTIKIWNRIIAWST